MKFNEDDLKEKKLKINERISIDLSKIGIPANKNNNDPNLKNPQWRMKVNKATGRKFSEFYPSKDKMVKPTCEQIQIWKNKNKPIKIIRCDNAGENNKLEECLKSSD